METARFEELMSGNNAELMCSEARKIILSKERAKSDMTQACNLVKRAEKLGYPEGAFWVGYLLLIGELVIKGKDNREAGMKRIHTASLNGSATARGYLNKFALEIQKKKSAKTPPVSEGPLTDFEGKEIKIDRTGIFSPVDAVLRYDLAAGNILRLSTNLLFMTTDESVFDNYGKYRKTVVKGIKEWEGEYHIFGGQKITVSLDVTAEDRLIDSVLINSMTDAFGKTMSGLVSKIGTEKMKDNLEAFTEDKRSATPVARKWRVTSPKQIIMVSDSGRFDEYEEIFHVAKHEFGHVLGLGDMYSSDSDGLPGVVKGTFKELDPYCLYDKMYYSVMCDHHGPVTDNDIEMLVLAFSENRWQGFQPEKINKTISEALGKGD